MIGALLFRKIYGSEKVEDILIDFLYYFLYLFSRRMQLPPSLLVKSRSHAARVDVSTQPT